MHNQGDAVVYKCKGVYRIEDVGTLDFTFADRKKKYYTLQSVGNAKDRAYVPIDDETNIRKPIEREAVLGLIRAQGLEGQIALLGELDNPYPYFTGAAGGHHTGAD